MSTLVKSLRETWYWQPNPNYPICDVDMLYFTPWKNPVLFSDTMLGTEPDQNVFEHCKAELTIFFWLYKWWVMYNNSFLFIVTSHLACQMVQSEKSIWCVVPFTERNVSNDKVLQSSLMSFIKLFLKHIFFSYSS